LSLGPRAARGGELIRSITQLWFSQPIAEVVRSANEMGADYYREHEAIVADHARRIAREMPPAVLEGGNIESLRTAIAPEVTQGRLGLVEVYRIGPGGHRCLSWRSNHRRCPADPYVRCPTGSLQRSPPEAARPRRSIHWMPAGISCAPGPSCATQRTIRSAS